MSETSNDYANKIKTQRRRQYKESESDGSDDDERKTKSVEKKISCKFCALSTCQISESDQLGEKPATSAKERIILPRDVESPPYTA